MATALSITGVDISGQPYGTSELGSGPLSSLFNTNATNSYYRYPADLGATQYNNSKNHWVTFSIYDVAPAGYQSSLGYGLSGAVTDAVALSAAGAVIGAGGVGAALASGQSVNTALANAAVNAGTTAIAAGSTNIALGVGINITAPISKISTTISLYMPETLAADYNSHYDEMNLSSDLGPTVSTLRGIANAGDAATDNLTHLATGSIGNETSSMPGVLAAAQNLETIGGVNIKNVSTLMLKAQGLSINPQVQMVYRGTGLREFQLSFTFTPKSREEALMVNSIIQQFRFYSSPTLSNAGQGTTGQTSLFLVPPSQFGIQFYVNGEESSILPKYGNCVLTSMNVNDAPNGFAAFTDGSMVQRILNLNFKELDILTRDYFSGRGVSSSTGDIEDRR
jgi:hypothetical protein